MPKTVAKIGTKQSTDETLRRLLSDAIGRSDKSRVQIAEMLSLHTGLRISKRMLDDWTAESKKGSRLPAAVIAGLSAVLHDDCLQRFLLSERQRRLLAVGEYMERVAVEIAGLPPRK